MSFSMTKPELQRIALKLFNQGIVNHEEIFYCQDLKGEDNKSICKCLDYIDELFRIGKTAFKKKYCIKH